MFVYIYYLSGTPTGLRYINLDLMQKRIGSLEEENRSLRKEYSQLAEDTDECEAQEQRLVNDIALRLGKMLIEMCIFIFNITVSIKKAVILLLTPISVQE